MCHLEPQGRQEEAEVVILGDLLEATEPKALPPAKEQQEQETKGSAPALEKPRKTALESYQEEFNQIFAKFPPTTPIQHIVRGELSIVRNGGGILLGNVLSDDVYGDGVGVINIFNEKTTPTALGEEIKKLKKEGKLKNGDSFVVVRSNDAFPFLSVIKVTESGYDIKLPTETDKAENKLRRRLGDYAFLTDVDRKKKLSQEYINMIAQYRKQEEEHFAELEKFHPRTPTNKKIDSNTYRKKAEEFAKELGLPPSANSFSDLQTRMHDIAHPIMYDMLGLSSKDIKKFFGTNDLVAEEALVNALEQMSRGAYPRGAATNGIMLARVLSRGTETASAYRNSEFSAKVEFLVNKMFQNPDLYRYLKVVRKANRISRTVTVAADM